LGVFVCGSLFDVYPTIRTRQSTRVPIVYHDCYSIDLPKSLLPVSKYGQEHFFRGKYKHVYDYLVTKEDIAERCFFAPKPVTDQDLLAVHSQVYLDRLKKPVGAAPVLYVSKKNKSLKQLNNERLFLPLRYITGGTIKAMELALKHGCAINLGGGYHHAKRSDGEGFCFYADIPLAIRKYHKINSKGKVLIVDCDVHQGNGNAWFFRRDSRVAIFDVYNQDLEYPGDMGHARRYITFDYPVTSGLYDTQYMAILEDNLPDAMDTFNPDLIIYNSGTDILDGDRFGGMHVSEQGIIDRDALVFRLAFENNIPIVMVLSGGYTKKSVRAIGKSIANIMRMRCVKPG